MMPGTCPYCGSYNMRHGMLLGTVWCDDCGEQIEHNAEPFDNQEEHDDETTDTATSPDRAHQHG